MNEEQERMNEVAFKRQLCSRAAYRDRKNGRMAEFFPEDCDIPERCPVFGWSLLKSHGFDKPTRRQTASVDRIDSSKGYTKDNVQIMSWLANSMKQDATPEELLLFAEWVFKTYGKK